MGRDRPSKEAIKGECCGPKYLLMDANAIEAVKSVLFEGYLAQCYPGGLGQFNASDMASGSGDCDGRTRDVVVN